MGGCMGVSRASRGWPIAQTANVPLGTQHSSDKLSAGSGQPNSIDYFLFEEGRSGCFRSIPEPLSYPFIPLPYANAGLPDSADTIGVHSSGVPWRPNRTPRDDLPL